MEFITHQQDTRVNWLPLAEFAANNGTSRPTKCTPCYPTQGTDPRMSFAGYQRENGIKDNVMLISFRQQMRQIHEHLREEMRRNHAVQEEGADHGQIPEPTILQGFPVWLDDGHVSTARPTLTLRWKRLGPCKVVRWISPYVLSLNCLRQYGSIECNLFPFWTQSRIILIEDNESIDHLPQKLMVKGQYQLSRVEESRIYRNQLQYPTRWTGYDSLTSEPAQFVDGLQEVPVIQQ